MILINQEEKYGPAYLCVKQIKVDKDPLILQDLQFDQRGVKILHDGKNFFVKENHMPIKQIHNYDVDDLLKKMNPYQLHKFQEVAGFLIAKRLSNGEYKLDARIKGSGGKPGFDTVITVGKVVLENTGALMKVAEKAATLLMLNAASKWVTGKNFGELTRGHNYDPDLAVRMKEYEKKQNEYHRDMRIKHGLSPMDTEFKWNEKHQCFVDENGDRYYTTNEPVIKPQTDVVYTGRTLPIVSPSKPVDLDEPITNTYKPEFYEDGTRIVDYENNPADKAWLEDFAKKICPSGGYVIGDVLIPVDEDLPSSPVDVAMPMPTPPQPNDPKHDKHVDEKLHEIEHNLAHVVTEGMHHIYEEASGHNFKERCELKYSIEKENNKYTSNTTPTPKIIANTTPPKTTAHQKMPSYNPGKRLEYWQKAQEEKKSSSSPKSTPAKVESVTVKQEAPVKLEPVKQEPVKQETNASRWANDYDYSSNEPDSSFLNSMNDDEVSDFFDGFPELYEAYTNNK